MTNIEIDKIAHVGVPVSNTEKSLAFYQDALGLEFLSTREISGDHISSGVEVPNAKIKVTLLKSNNFGWQAAMFLSESIKLIMGESQFSHTSTSELSKT